jgi:hypothetical protein
MRKFFSPLTLSALLVFFIYVLIASKSLDPDFGWHLRMGQIIKADGIPATDPFSYTMPSFPFVDHEWFTNVLINRLHESIGYLGLAVISSSLAISAWLISLKNPLRQKERSKIWILEVMLLILAGAALIPFFGIRPQVLSWLYFAILFRIVFVPWAWEKLKYFLPILFFLWANTHGSFAAGIVILFVATGLRFLRLKEVSLKDFAVLLICLGFTFLNPYQGRIWGEVWLQVSDASLRWSIIEWMPALTYFNFPLFIFIVFSGLLIWKYRSKFFLEEKAIFLALLSQAIASQRHLPIWALMALPMTYISGGFLYYDAKKIKYGAKRYKKVIGIGFLGILAILVFESILILRSSGGLTEQNFYPKGGVEFISGGMPSGNIFSQYGWGGYLIWKLPEKKVFIDGRMPSWRWQADIPQEENYAMETYKQILKGEKDYKDVFLKYKVDTLLLPPPKPESFLTALDRKLRVFLTRVGIDFKEYDLIKTLEEDGWQRVYEDSVSVVYEKPS